MNTFSLKMFFIRGSNQGYSPISLITRVAINTVLEIYNNYLLETFINKKRLQKGSLRASENRSKLKRGVEYSL